jgi:hypothetical protein
MNDVTYAISTLICSLSITAIPYYTCLITLKVQLRDVEISVEVQLTVTSTNRRIRRILKLVSEEVVELVLLSSPKTPT